ncbi:MAG: hypothetical protein ABI760_19365 [Ferruginibacter sp.]
MEKIKTSRNQKLKLAIYLALSVAFLSALTMPLSNKQSVNPNGTFIVEAGKKLNNELTGKDQQAEESKAAFNEAYTVFMSPRCMNCHPAGDVPLQGDDSHLHAQGVKRGQDGNGLYAMKCKNCHQDTDIAGDHMPPGHPNWRLPPATRRMVFEGKSAKELATTFKDMKSTGFKTMGEFIKHVEDDSLVKHSFTYGSRPPLSHEEFVAKIKEWIAKGAAIPDN